MDASVEPVEPATEPSVDPPAERPAGWLRGVLEPCILALVSDGESYGYELTVSLEAAGLGKVAGGSLYPALARLEKQGLVTADWRAGDGGPGRKFYAITPEGRATLDEQAVRWDDFASAVARLLTGATVEGGRG